MWCGFIVAILFLEFKMERYLFIERIIKDERSAIFLNIQAYAYFTHTVK